MEPIKAYLCPLCKTVYEVGEVTEKEAKRKAQACLEQGIPAYVYDVGFTFPPQTEEFVIVERIILVGKNPTSEGLKKHQPGYLVLRGKHPAPGEWPEKNILQEIEGAAQRDYLGRDRLYEGLPWFVWVQRHLRIKPEAAKFLLRFIQQKDLTLEEFLALPLDELKRLLAEDGRFDVLNLANKAGLVKVMEGYHHSKK